MRCCFLVLFTGLILTVHSFGQSSQHDTIKIQYDSVKADLNLPDEIVKKLDNKDIVEIIKYREKLVQEKELAKAKMNLRDPNVNMIEESTATIWTILFILFVLSLFVIPYFFNFKKAKARQQIILKLIEKDKDIPLELFSNSSKPQKPIRSDLHKGIILIAFGLALCIVAFTFLKVHYRFWTIGLIPMFLGIAYLISFRLDRSYKGKSEID
jgi:hypothetical protein